MVGRDGKRPAPCFELVAKEFFAHSISAITPRIARGLGKYMMTKRTPLLSRARVALSYNAEIPILRRLQLDSLEPPSRPSIITGNQAANLLSNGSKPWMMRLNYSTRGPSNEHWKAIWNPRFTWANPWATSQILGQTPDRNAPRLHARAVQDAWKKRKSECAVTGCSGSGRGDAGEADRGAAQGSDGDARSRRASARIVPQWDK